MYMLTASVLLFFFNYSNNLLWEITLHLTPLVINTGQAGAVGSPGTRYSLSRPGISTGNSLIPSQVI